jgi:hypothetical protein
VPNPDEPHPLLLPRAAARRPFFSPSSLARPRAGRHPLLLPQRGGPDPRPSWCPPVEEFPHLEGWPARVASPRWHQIVASTTTKPGDHTSIPPIPPPPAPRGALRVIVVDFLLFLARPAPERGIQECGVWGAFHRGDRRPQQDEDVAKSGLTPMKSARSPWLTPLSFIFLPMLINCSLGWVCMDLWMSYLPA